VPFYAAVPSPTIDWTIDDGAAIPIEDRAGDEVRSIAGRDDTGTPTRVASPAARRPSPTRPST
jgi:methylthioribose-1-phosphate isomerase